MSAVDEYQVKCGGRGRTRNCYQIVISDALTQNKERIDSGRILCLTDFRHLEIAKCVAAS